MTVSKEQDLPHKGNNITIYDAQSRILNTLQKQNAKGYEKYKSYLSTFNGRDSIRDMWEELADLVNYAETLSQEYERMHIMLYSLYLEVPEAKVYMQKNFTVEELDFIIPERYKIT